MITLAIGIVSWPPVARITRAEFLRIRELEYLTAARSSGVSDWKLVSRVILPNALPPIIGQAALMVGSAILFEAGLSFLGLPHIFLLRKDLQHSPVLPVQAFSL